MKIYELESRYVQVPEREGETLFGGKAVRVFRNVRALPLNEYVVALDDEVLVDTTGKPAYFGGLHEAVETAKRFIRERAAGRLPVILPEEPEPPRRARRAPGRSPRRRRR